MARRSTSSSGQHGWGKIRNFLSFHINFINSRISIKIRTSHSFLRMLWWVRRMSLTTCPQFSKVGLRYVVPSVGKPNRSLTFVRIGVYDFLRRTVDNETLERRSALHIDPPFEHPTCTSRLSGAAPKSRNRPQMKRNPIGCSKNIVSLDDRTGPLFSPEGNYCLQS